MNQNHTFFKLFPFFIPKQISGILIKIWEARRWRWYVRRWIMIGWRWQISWVAKIRHESVGVRHLTLIEILSVVHMIKIDKRIVWGKSYVATLFVVVKISVDIDISRCSKVHVLHSSTFGRWNLPPWCINCFFGRDVSFEYATQSPNFLPKREKNNNN